MDGICCGGATSWLPRTKTTSKPGAPRFWDPNWVSSREIEPGTGVDIADGEVAVIRHRRHVTATKSRCLLEADRVKLEGEARRRCWSSVELRNLPRTRLDSTTLAAKSRPPFQPPGCSNLGAVSPVSDCHSFLAQRQWFYRSARKTHMAINTSMADAVGGATSWLPRT
ncbi:hypothetical protein MRX96_000449 [Rhipicephalus microplus]